MTSIRIIAGLGNPGLRYERTRHNAGFLVLDKLAQTKSASGWRNQEDLSFAEININSQKIFLCKPQSFMNCSGEPLQRFMNFYKISPEELIVVHDEIDLPFNMIRLKQGGGDGGHNGLKSITQQLSNPNYYRVRMGVGRPPGNDSLSQADVSSWVLGEFSNVGTSLGSGDFKLAFEEYLKKGSLACELLILEGLLKAQNKLN